ncbi:MAG: 3'-5' exonuclease [Pirellulaceae bacterium]
MKTNSFIAPEWQSCGPEDILASLTPSQREAIEHIEGPQQIIAGPGSGKTRVVTHRIAYMLLKEIPDYCIVALTFTNKAADEMRQRVDALCPDRHVWIGTFHRFCAQQLRHHASLVGLQENYSILDVEASMKVLREAIEEAGVELVHDTPRRIAGAISWAKNDLITPEQYEPAPGDAIGTLVDRVYPHYQRLLLGANSVDFDDLLMHVAVLLRDNPQLRRTLDKRFRYIMVDEYQDTNLAQYAIVRSLSVDYPNLSVTGDPDQSIYGWRGATIRNILEFERDFSSVHVVRLEENFRSTQSILQAADQLIANNVNRKEKRLEPRSAKGKPVRVSVYPTARLEADAIVARIANEVAARQRRYQDYAIFYRTNALSRTLEQSFRTMGVPYQIVRGLEFYQRQEIKDILAYVHLLNNPANDAAFLRIVNTPPRGIGKVTVGRLRHYARQHRLPLFEAARRAGVIESLSKRTAAAVAKFVALMDSVQSRGTDAAEMVIGELVRASGYRDWLSASGEEERLENLDELLTDAREFDESHPEEGGLEAYLEQTSLVADVDDWDTENNCVSMMTLHAAKGLEFPVVFVVGLEEDMLPHLRSKEDPNQVEEERRLLFVGMTRAKEELHLGAAQQRTIRGKVDVRVTSRFLMELPREEMDVVGDISYLDADYQPVDDWGNGSYDCQSECLADLDFPPDWDVGCPGDQPWGDSATLECQGDASSEDPEPPAARASLVTAAEMAESDSEDAKISPDAFRQGMAVVHPSYGIGKIVTVEGTGAKRSACVQFSEPTGKRRFQLAFSPLRPIGR